MEMEALVDDGSMHVTITERSSGELLLEGYYPNDTLLMTLRLEAAPARSKVEEWQLGLDWETTGRVLAESLKESFGGIPVLLLESWQETTDEEHASSGSVNKSMIKGDSSLPMVAETQGVFTEQFGRGTRDSRQELAVPSSGSGLSANTNISGNEANVYNAETVNNYNYYGPPKFAGQYCSNRAPVQSLTVSEPPLNLGSDYEPSAQPNLCFVVSTLEEEMQNDVARLFQPEALSAKEERANKQMLEHQVLVYSPDEGRYVVVFAPSSGKSESWIQEKASNISSRIVELHPSVAAIRLLPGPVGENCEYQNCWCLAHATDEMKGMAKEISNLSASNSQLDKQLLEETFSTTIRRQGFIESRFASEHFETQSNRLRKIVSRLVGAESKLDMELVPSYMKLLAKSVGHWSVRQWAI